MPPNVPGSGTNTFESTYNRDRELTLFTRPDGSDIGFGYDGGGRLETVSVAAGEYRYSYDENTGMLTTATAPDGGQIVLQYDGSLSTGAIWSGTVQGEITWDYDADLSLSSEHVVCPSASSLACQPIAFAYDQDKLLIASGDLAIERNPDNGTIASVTIGDVNEQWQWNEFGETRSRTARWNGQPLYAEQLTRDALGRITVKQVTIGATTTLFEYGYEAAGRLSDVRTDGALTAHYEYDPNGNRLSRQSDAEVANASCDNQDRLTSYGAATYTYSPNGDLASKTDASGQTTYVYDELGNLTRVNLPDGRIIEYTIDADDRRVAKRVDGADVYRLLYSDSLRPAAMVDGAGNVTARFVYGSRSNVPDLIIKGNDTYRIVTDHLGSPVLVVMSPPEKSCSR